ncbi:heat repeat-containing protein [Cystoisospora suis]|uniref:Heat repeat-containing protein n=1 Tax=Cystoisospora suis TaxID=483139 RepID=A0A2C6KTC4_9APIC|nr:heat repeat-containing protein [Cystoisospora suis]
MSSLAPLVAKTGPFLDRASASVKALMSIVSKNECQYFEEGHFNASQVKKELQDDSIDSKVTAMKRLLAAHATGTDVSGLLPEVVKAIAVPDLELKRLVYLFLIQHAEGSRDLALLSINSFQKDLTDRNQVVRASALKALASIRLLEVVQLLVASVKRASVDSSPFVRRTAAQCIIKVFSLDQDQFEDLKNVVLTLLADVEISVVGSALIAYRELCIRHSHLLLLCHDDDDNDGEHALQDHQANSTHSHHPYHLDCTYTATTQGGRGGENVMNTSISSSSPSFSNTNGGGGLSNASTTSCLQNKDNRKKQREFFKSQIYALSLLHSHFRRLQQTFLQLESFAQIVAIDIFLRYCRVFFADPGEQLKNHYELQTHRQAVAEERANRSVGMRQRDQVSAPYNASMGSVSSSSSSSSSPVSSKDISESSFTIEQFLEDGQGPSGNPVPQDFRLFLSNLVNLLHSDSPGVVVAASSALFYLLPSSPNAWKPAVHPLLRCMYTSPPDLQEPLLHTIACLGSAYPPLFLPHIRSFFLRFSDPPIVRQGKLRILRLLLSSSSSSFSPSSGVTDHSYTNLAYLLLPELRTYIHWPGDKALLSSCFRFLTFLAQRFPELQAPCMQIFVQLLDSPSSVLSSEAVLSLQTLLQQQLQQQKKQKQENESSTGMKGHFSHHHPSSSSMMSREMTPTSSPPLSLGGKGDDQLGRLVLQLANHFPHIHAPAPRASVIWIIGYYQRQVGWVSADFLRQVVMNFKIESEEVKLQILSLALKVWAFHWMNRQGEKNMRKEDDDKKRRQEDEEGQGGERDSTKGRTSSTIHSSLDEGQATRGGDRMIPIRKDDNDDEQGEKKNPIGGLFQASQDNSSSSLGGYSCSTGDQKKEHFSNCRGEEEEANEGDLSSRGNQSRHHRPSDDPSTQRGSSSSSSLLPLPTCEESARAFPRLDKILKYVCEAASFDISYDVRDVSRLYYTLSRLALLSSEVKRGERDDKILSSIPSTSSLVDRSSSNNEKREELGGREDEESRLYLSSQERRDPLECRDQDKPTIRRKEEDNLTASDLLQAFAGWGGGGREGDKCLAVLDRGNGDLKSSHHPDGSGMSESSSSFSSLQGMQEFACRYMREIACGRSLDLEDGGEEELTKMEIKKSFSQEPFSMNREGDRMMTMMEMEEKKNGIQQGRGRQAEKDSAMMYNSGYQDASPYLSSSSFLPVDYVTRTQEEVDGLTFKGYVDKRSSRRDIFETPYVLGTLSDFIGERMIGYTSFPSCYLSEENMTDDLRCSPQHPDLDGNFKIILSPYGVITTNTASQGLLSDGRPLGDQGKCPRGGGDYPNNRYSSSTSQVTNYKEIKSISSADVIVTRNLATMMARSSLNEQPFFSSSSSSSSHSHLHHTNPAKARLTPTDLDDFYSDLRSTEGKEEDRKKRETPGAANHEIYRNTNGGGRDGDVFLHEKNEDMWTVFFPRGGEEEKKDDKEEEEEERERRRQGGGGDAGIQNPSQRREGEEEMKAKNKIFTPSSSNSSSLLTGSLYTPAGVSDPRFYTMKEMSQKGGRNEEDEERRSGNRCQRGGGRESGSARGGGIAILGEDDESEEEEERRKEAEEMTRRSDDVCDGMCMEGNYEREGERGRGGSDQGGKKRGENKEEQIGGGEEEEEEDGDWKFMPVGGSL